MTIKNYIAIATTIAAFTITSFAQWHPEIDKVKGRKVQTQSIQSPRDVASGQATGRRKAPRARQDKLGNFEIQDLKSPRDSQTGQSSSKQKTPQALQGKLGNFEIQDVKSPRDIASGQAMGITSPRDVASGQATGKRQHKPIAKRPGFMDYTDDAAMPNVVAGQNSGGTITNQRSRRPNRRK
ncbi:MAG: hypothetical protein JNM09_16175 [Blastocatellia bacterium]|nr:hypothetical protein [Blastocatellia bacterium]